MFYDIYALYDLYWRYGEGKKHYGYKVDQTIMPGGLNDRVDFMFEEAAKSMSKVMVIGMANLISDESEHAEDELWVNQDELKEWLNESYMQYLLKTGEFVNPTPAMILKGKPSFSNMSDFFASDLWKSPNSGWFQEYGGEVYVSPETGKEQVYSVGGDAWAKIAKLSQTLLDYYKSNKTVKMMETLDKLFHIHHNNGSIFNKPVLSKIGVSLDTSDLDFRRDARTAEDFVDRVSPQIKNLINAVTRY